jgi:hypothetical protein
MNQKNENNNENYKSNKFGLPSNYFSEASNSITNKIEWLDEHKAFKILNSNNNKIAFKIPENYFEKNEKNLKINSIGILKNRQQKKDVTLKISYAIAALLILTLSFFIYTTILNKTEFKNCGSLACIDKTELLKSNHLENIENDELYELVDQKKLEEKLKNKLDEKSIQLNKSNLDTDINNYNQQEFLDEI